MTPIKALLLAGVFLAPHTLSRAGAAERTANDSLIVTTQWLAAHLKDPGLVLLQVDYDNTLYAAGHIPGARKFPLEVIAVSANGLMAELPSADAVGETFEALGVSDATHVVVYYAGEAPSSARAIVALDFIGHDRVSILNGGLPKWRAEKRAVTTALPSVTRGKLHVRAHPEVIATAPWIQQRIGKPGMALIDTRTDGEYLGSGDRHGMPSAGHLEGARQLQWEQLFQGDSGSAGGALLKDRVALSKLYSDRMQTGDTVVTYCAVGYRASATYLAARILGLPVKMYDGSYQGWALAKLPVRAGSTP